MKVISGGQTGADRGAVDAAISVGADWGGWVPKGRKAEDGRIPDRYDRFEEHLSASYPPRTLSNVRDSDATVIFSYPGKVTPGCRLTIRYCRELEKRFVYLDAGKAVSEPDFVHGQLARWLNDLPSPPAVLNVAGCRESKCLGLQKAVEWIVARILRAEVVAKP